MDYTKEDNRKHFIERLSERYVIVITEHEYENLSIKEYKGLFSKNKYSSIGTIEIQDQTVWVQYNSDTKSFVTAYPPCIGTDILELFRTCFGGRYHQLSIDIYNLILEEINNEKTDFETIKEAAIHYFTNSNYPTIMIDKYKYGKVKDIKICNEIKQILYGAHKSVKLSLTRHGDRQYNNLTKKTTSG